MNNLNEFDILKRSEQFLQSFLPIPNQNFTHVRPKLNREDLLLIREAFIYLHKQNLPISKSDKICKLYRDMLRQTPKENLSTETLSI